MPKMTPSKEAQDRLSQLIKATTSEMRKSKSVPLTETDLNQAILSAYNMAKKEGFSLPDNVKSMKKSFFGDYFLIEEVVYEIEGVKKSVVTKSDAVVTTASFSVEDMEKAEKGGHVKPHNRTSRKGKVYTAGKGNPNGDKKTPPIHAIVKEGLSAAGEWIQAAAGKSEVSKPHIKRMLSATQDAFDGNLKPGTGAALVDAHEWIVAVAGKSEENAPHIGRMLNALSVATQVWEMKYGKSFSLDDNDLEKGRTGGHVKQHIRTSKKGKAYSAGKGTTVAYQGFHDPKTGTHYTQSIKVSQKLFDSYNARIQTELKAKLPHKSRFIATPGDETFFKPLTLTPVPSGKKIAFLNSTQRHFLFGTTVKDRNTALIVKSIESFSQGDTNMRKSMQILEDLNKAIGTTSYPSAPDKSTIQAKADMPSAPDKNTAVKTADKPSPRTGDEKVPAPVAVKFDDSTNPATQTATEGMVKCICELCSRPITVPEGADRMCKSCISKFRPTDEILNEND